VDVRYLHCNGLLKLGYSFSLRWSRAGRQTGSIGGVAYGDRETFFYRHNRGSDGDWEDFKEAVSLGWTACNFGGTMPWFICPGAGCGRRVALHYRPGHYFLSRHRRQGSVGQKQDKGNQHGPQQPAVRERCPHGRGPDRHVIVMGLSARRAAR
jgi:hypothetical protein